MNRHVIAIMCILSLLWCLSPALAEPAATKKLTDAMLLNVESGDGRIKVSWHLKDGPIRDKMAIKGIRIYQMKDGPETGYNIPLYTLVDDEKNANASSTVKKLKNGEQYIFQIKAYNYQNREFLETTVAAFPGSSPAGNPEKPSNVYAVAGEGRIAIYWVRNTEADLAGYEVYRKAPHDRDFSLVSRMLKVVRFEGKDNINQVMQAINPGMYVDTTVENGKQYQYRIRAADTQGLFSEYSDVLTARPAPNHPPSGENVLLLVNANEGDSNGNHINDSEEVALHYAKLRGVPEKNILHLYVGGKLRLRTDTIDDYELYIQKPIQEYLIKNNLLGTIRYIVPCYGMPIRFAGRALDSKLADLFDRFTFGKTMGTSHPYYNSSKHFDGTYGIYLVSRLDGPSVEIANTLVDKALAAEKNVTAHSGTAYFATYGRKKGDWTSDAAEAGERLGVKVALKHPDFFSKEMLPADCYWYYAWRHPYRKIRNELWPIGAVAAHLISDSFKWIRNDKKYGTSWVQGMLEDGITGTFGAVIEPYLQAYTRPDLFFPHFWSGEFNFSESYMMATPTVQWAMSAVGDPLYRLAKPSVTHTGI